MRSARRLDDSFPNRSVTDPWAAGDGNTARNGLNGWIDQVELIVLVRPRNISGEGEAGEAGNGDICGSTDAEFVHSTAPDGDRPSKAEVMDRSGFTKSADATDLDVDHTSRVEFKCLSRILRRMNRLIQTDRRLQLRLKSSMVNDVVMGQRLTIKRRPKSSSALSVSTSASV